MAIYQKKKIYLSMNHSFLNIIDVKNFNNTNQLKHPVWKITNENDRKVENQIKISYLLCRLGVRCTFNVQEKSLRAERCLIGGVREETDFTARSAGCL